MIDRKQPIGPLTQAMPGYEGEDQFKDDVVDVQFDDPVDAESTQYIFSRLLMFEEDEAPYYEFEEPHWSAWKAYCKHHLGHEPFSSRKEPDRS